MGVPLSHDEDTYMTSQGRPGFAALGLKTMDGITSAFRQSRGCAAFGISIQYALQAVTPVVQCIEEYSVAKEGDLPQ